MLHYNRARRGIPAHQPVQTKDPNRPCSYIGCTNKHNSRGMCRFHVDQVHTRPLRKSREHHVPFVGFSGLQWSQKIEMQGGRCRGCGVRFGPGVPVTMDHIKPFARGGAHVLSNTQGLCLSCNCSKRADWGRVCI